MATVTCPNCSRDVPEEARECPHCGQRLEGIGVESPPPQRDPRPESSTEGADYRVGGIDRPPDEPGGSDDHDRVLDEDESRSEGPHGHTAPRSDAGGDAATVDADATAAPTPGLRWTAILAGFVTFIVAELVFVSFLGPLVAWIATLAVGLLVTYRLAPHRKVMHAALAFIFYRVFAYGLTLLLGGGAPPGGAVGP